MTFDSLCIHEIFLQTSASAQNSLGEWLYTYTTSATGVDCRVSPLTNSERIDMTGRFDDVRYKCFTPASTSISKDNRVVYNSEVYRVKECSLDSNSHHRTSLLVLVD